MVKGRKPLLTKALEASGTKKRNPNRYRNEPPKAPAGLPDKPPHIARNPTASGYWDHAVSQMAAMDILTKAERSILTIYAETMTLREQSFADCEYGHYGRLGGLCIRLLTELGLSPTSRMKLATPKQEEQDAFMEWLSQNKIGGETAGDN